MGFKCGIVGLPNVGKSTIFNAIAKAHAAASNYPFCTIEPNVGMVPVPDPRLWELSRLYKPQKTAPTTVEFYDIAGLVAGASKGEGLGNQFLGHIKEVEAILHVVRCFRRPQYRPCFGHDRSRTRDIDVIDTELCLKDLDTINTALQTKPISLREVRRQGIQGKNAGLRKGQKSPGRRDALSGAFGLY